MNVTSRVRYLSYFVKWMCISLIFLNLLYYTDITEEKIG